LELTGATVEVGGKTYWVHLSHDASCEQPLSARVPSLPGCHTQGANIADALENVKHAIREWLDVAARLELKQNME
jgi:predicted RNase H-like HicB family nuclease